jgi:hypothetical protein
MSWPTSVSGTSVWTGRALQAENDDLEMIGLAHLYPALERNVCVPGHHGYAAFELAVTADYDAQSAVERELVLKLASVLWRLRRASAIEAGLFRLQARQLLQFRARRQDYRNRQKIVDEMYWHAVAIEGDTPHHEEPATNLASGSPDWPANQSDGLTRAFVGLNNLPTCPLDRLSRYEAALWRQACQILFTLQCLDRRKPWERRSLR